MSIFSKTRNVAIATAFLAAGLYGCGSASNNDQGTSFTAIGFFQDGDGDVGDAGRTTVLFSDSGDFDGRSETTFMGMRNRLSTQFIRVDRIDCDYTVPGASVSIPSDSMSTNALLEAAGGGSASSSSGSSGGTAGTSVQYSEFFIVSPDIYSYLNVNSNSLPELPFRMTATCRAVGVSQSGDTLVTNDLNYEIVFTRAAASPTEGNGGGAGTGGDIDGSEGDDSDSLVDDSVSDDDFVIE